MTRTAQLQTKASTYQAYRRNAMARLAEIRPIAKLNPPGIATEPSGILKIRFVVQDFPMLTHLMPTVDGWSFELILNFANWKLQFTACTSKWGRVASLTISKWMDIDSVEVLQLEINVRHHFFLQSLVYLLCEYNCGAKFYDCMF